MDIVEIIKWPAAFVIGSVICFLLFLLFFMTEIRQKILSMTRMKGPKNAEFNFGEQQIGEQQKSSEKLPIEAANELTNDSDELMYALNDSNTPSVVKRVSRDLLEGIKSIPSSKIINLLILRLAEARTELIFEKIYRIIFSGQIKLLKELNNLYMLDKQNAQKIFEAHQQNNMLSNKQEAFDEWLSYLKNNELIQENNDTLQITEVGRDFLIYLTKNRLLEDKSR
jgi:hypothetical protein